MVITKFLLLCSWGEQTDRQLNNELWIFRVDFTYSETFCWRHQITASHTHLRLADMTLVWAPRQKLSGCSTLLNPTNLHTPFRGDRLENVRSLFLRYQIDIWGDIFIGIRGLMLLIQKTILSGQDLFLDCVSV